MNTAFWKNKRVFITGHTGFKGSWLSLWLESMEAIVCGYSLKPVTSPNLFEVADVKQGITSIENDICQAQSLQSAILDFQPEIIFHLAAQAIVRESYTDPLATYQTNVMGTANVLEAVRQVDSIRTVIIVTSDKCYENREWYWGYRENEAMGGYDPYSSSKGCAELVTSAYQRSYFDKDSRVTVSSVRAGNVIGGGDWAVDRLIPDLCRAFSQQQLAEIRNPNAVRPWQHVLEPLFGYLLLAEKSYQQPQQFLGGWNFASDYEDAQPVSWIADKISKLWGDNVSWHTNDHCEHPHEANILRLDCSKAHLELGWSPRLNLTLSLEMTVNWYKAYTEQSDMRFFTKQQIQQFIEME